MEITETKRQALPLISREEAARRHLLTARALATMHLLPTAEPVARAVLPEGEELYYHPDRVKVEEARPARSKDKKAAPPPTAADGTPATLNAKQAEQLGYFTKEVLLRAYYEPTDEPVAFLQKRNGQRVPLFDRATCRRLPLPCVKCGSRERYRAKLCRTCYEKELALKRRAGDARRDAHYGMSRERVLFFDLELTGVFDHDEILSVSIVNGKGETVFHSLTRPVHTKRWKRTEKIHGITPEMVKNAPTLKEISGQLATIISAAERLVAYGTSTDFTHLRRIYATREERNRMHDKLVDCAAEFSSYIHEHEIDLVHRSLSDAMAHFALDWDGVAHTSIADAMACRLVFERLFPHYFKKEEE